MVVAFDDLQFHLFEATATDDLEKAPAGPGWYWHECHMAQCGPFTSLSVTLANMTDWVAARYGRD